MMIIPESARDLTHPPWRTGRAEALTPASELVDIGSKHVDRWKGYSACQIIPSPNIVHGSIYCSFVTFT